jgi:RNA polymerase sigma-70 factor, ECF subfamily
MIEAELQTGWTELTKQLHSFVARRVPRADADDVVQEALVRIQRNVAELRDDNRFGAWVYQVTRSAVADHLRKNMRESAGVEALSAEPIERDNEEDVLTASLVACLSKFVAELPSPYREAITLTDLQGLSQKEAAEIVGISLSGMKTRVQRGREKLREMFDRCCSFTQDTRGHVIDYEPHCKNCD